MPFMVYYCEYHNGIIKQQYGFTLPENYTFLMMDVSRLIFCYNSVKYNNYEFKVNLIIHECALVLTLTMVY